jgi:signal transduction histidine kinase
LRGFWRESWPILLALLPFGVGLGVYFELHGFFEPVVVLAFKADVGSALAVVGGLMSLPLVSAVLAQRAERRRGELRAARAAEEQEENHRRFLRRLDHELKNPLTALRAALANLAGTAEPTERARIQGDVQHQAERLSRLVADLRKLAELEERPLEQATVELPEVLEEIVAAACEHPAYAGRQVRVVISQVPWRLPALTGDRDLLGLAFYNLVENALKYTAESDAVEVRAFEDRRREEGRWLAVEIADTGPGVDPEDVPLLFEELFRGTNARGVEGSGLGLALVRRVIERHGGEVFIRSRQEGGRGTVVTVRLPIKK